MIIRKATNADLASLLFLYKAVSKLDDGIARTADEIDADYISNIFNQADKNGFIFVAENPKNPAQIIGCISCSKIGPQCFNDTLSNLTILVDPNFHGQGIGRKIFLKLLETAKKNNIARIELTVRQSNPKAIKLYQSLGFEIEGLMRKRILNSRNELEVDNMMAWLNPDYYRIKI